MVHDGWVWMGCHNVCPESALLDHRQLHVLKCPCDEVELHSLDVASAGSSSPCKACNELLCTLHGTQICLPKQRLLGWQNTAQ